MRWYGLVTVFGVLGYSEAGDLHPMVDTKIGLIRGLKATNGNYSMFLGIPYAMVNKSNPFGVSLPYPKFEEIFNAFDDSAICPQTEEFGNTITGTLDCLHLNIYVPQSASSKNPLPVMVWIYGGGFLIGFAGRYLYGPKYLVRHDVILVTINYRLGPYGFMCLNTPEVPGNQGLKDQVSALRWIKDNIAVFGGDVEQITVFGESAGGASVDYHLMSKQELLFNKAIMQSGVATAPWAIGEPDINAPIRLSQHLGFATDDLNQALSFLAGVDTKLVIATVAKLSIRFSACVEEDFVGVEKMITVRSDNDHFPKVKSVSILSGYNSNEMIGFYVSKKPEDYDKMENIFRNRLETTFNLGDDLDRMASYVRHFYIGDDKVSEAVKRELIEFHSDFSMYHPVQRSLDKYLKNHAKAVYHYLFSYVGNRNFVRNRFHLEDGGAAHADEIGYLFDISYEDEEVTADDQLIIDRITTLWTNFAKYGDPTPETSELLSEKWLPVTKESLNYLDINKELTIGTRPFRRRLSFWDLIFALNKKNVKGYKEDL